MVRRLRIAGRIENDLKQNLMKKEDEVKELENRLREHERRGLRQDMTNDGAISESAIS
jgi:hypothetical protein